MRPSVSGDSINTHHALGELDQAAVATHILEAEDAGFAADVILAPMQKYKAFVITDNALAYKGDPATNWHAAGRTPGC